MTKAMITPTKTKAEAAKAYNEVSDMMYRQECHGGSVRKLERIEKEFTDWKAANGFDQREHMEDIIYQMEKIM
jgi:cell division FtsZ-interacting protein ZapD